MKTSVIKSMDFENLRYHGNRAMPESRQVINKLTGITLVAVFLLSMLVVWSPHFFDLLIRGFSSSSDLLSLLAGVLVCLTLPLAIFRTVQFAIEYHNARKLDDVGMLVKGSVLDKWAERANGKSIYYLRYAYLENRNARQTINKTTFQELECGEKVFVLYLEAQTHISRLDLD